MLQSPMVGTFVGTFVPESSAPVVPAAEINMTAPTGKELLDLLHSGGDLANQSHQDRSVDLYIHECECRHIYMKTDKPCP